MKRDGRMRLLAVAAIAVMSLAGVARAVPAAVIASIDLSRPFGAPVGWRFIATQGPAIADPTGGEGEDEAPGAIRLCITRDKGTSCRPDLDRLLRLSRGDDLFSEPHFLNGAEIVQGTANRALLLVRASSVHAANGDQRIGTALLAYDKTKDGFLTVYAHSTGRNNNQEIRYVTAGPLKGAVIAAEPTQDAPFSFWITVSQQEAGLMYSQKLRYRSATRYGDGNLLAVIDSEMPNIQQRLGLWKVGMPLPTPRDKACPRPRLINKALWCA
jgi:hypothetical protein